MLALANWRNCGHSLPGTTTWRNPSIVGILSELLSAPGFKDRSTTGGLVGLTAVLQSEGGVGETGEVGNTATGGPSSQAPADP